MAKGNDVVSQSKTMWVPKGTIVNGKKVPKGYVAQYGKPEKKVTARVQMVEQTMGVAKGDTQKYVEGRRVTEKFGQTTKPKSKPKATPPSSGMTAAQRAEAARRAAAAKKAAAAKAAAQRVTKARAVKQGTARLAGETAMNRSGNTPAARPSGITIDTSRLRGQKPGYSSVNVSLPSSKPGNKNVMDSLAAWMKGKKSGPSLPSINVGGRPRDGAIRPVTRTVNGKRVQVRQRYSAKTNKWSDIK